MKLYLLAVIGFIFFSCTQKKTKQDIHQYFSKKTSENIQLKLNKISTLTLENHEEESIGAPLYNVEFDTSGNMYFFDTIESKFIIYDNKGRFLKTLGRVGRGPIEFELVYGYTLDNKNNLYVYDDALRRIKVIDDSLKLSSSYAIDNKSYYITSHDLEVVNDNLYLGILGIEAASVTDNSEKLINSPLIMFYDIENQLEEKRYNYIGTYDPYLMEIESYYYRPIFSIDRKKETILVSHQNSYRFQEFDLKTGNLIKYFGFKSENYGEGEKKSSRNKNRKENFVNTLSESNNEMVFTTDEFIGNFYLSGTEQWFDSKDLSDLRYFLSIYSRENYTYLTTFQVDYRLIKVHDNKFYFIENENPEEFKIGVYELIEV
tara:strand:+ start:676 stop:1797 length:1122 start_codon:yes stop_codon:yes gene_type:complete